MDLEIREQIKVRLEELKNDSAKLQIDFNAVAARNDLLPLFVDWEKCWAINADGQVFTFFHDDSFTPDAIVGKPEEETSLRLKNVALYQGSKNYPELKPLIPAKLDDAYECPYCVSKGIDPSVTERAGLVCYCGGLGWIPKED